MTMYGLLLEFLQPSNDIIRNDDLCDIVVDFLEFGVDMRSASQATKHGLGYVVNAATANPKELRECLKGCLLGGHLELLDVYWRYASQDLKNQMLECVWDEMQDDDEKIAASMIEHLIGLGADVNAKFALQRTLLHFGCGSNKSELFVQVLVSNGADLNARDYRQVCRLCVLVLLFII